MKGKKEVVKQLSDIDKALIYFNDLDDPLFFSKAYKRSIIDLEGKRSKIMKA